MPKKETAENADQEQVTPPTCGVINPYALAEHISGRSIDWDAARNVPELLEDILQTPYDELFDPVFEGPLYAGLRLDRSLALQHIHSPLLDVTVEVEDDDLRRAASGGIDRLRDLGPRFQTEDIAGISVLHSESASGGRLVLTLRLPDKERLQQISRVLSPDIVRTIAYDPEAKGASASWTPPGGRWSDPGTFFHEATEFFDPVQGAVGNCYFIAALSAMAWATPFGISQRTRATGTAQQSFVDAVTFYHPGEGRNSGIDVEVTEALPVGAAGSAIYCRSSEAGEIWPGVYEKAYAKHKTGTGGDMPDITATALGDPVAATAQLNGGRPSYYGTSARSANQLWDIVRSNSRGGRTFRPMTAWTYSTASAIPWVHDILEGLYRRANIVASHAYTVLGWDYRDGRKYLILRNPWGHTEPTVGVLGGTTFLYDVSWWRPIALAPNDGTFGIEVSAFKSYFAGLGVTL